MKTIKTNLTELMSYTACHRYVFADNADTREFYRQEICRGFENADEIINELKVVVNIAKNNLVK